MRMNFTTLEKAIPDAPEHKERREAKREVKRMSKKDVLGLRKTPWEQSVNTTSKTTERQSCQIPKHDPTLFQYNYRAEVLPKPNMQFVSKPGAHDFDHTKLYPDYTPERSSIPPASRAGELDVHPDLMNKKNWNSSTYLDHKSLREEVEARSLRCMRNSRQKNAIIVREGYVGPVEREKLRMERFRAEREAKRNGTWQEPAAPAPASNNVDDGYTAPPRKSKSRKYKEYYNDGVYEYSKIADGYVWSCSMNPNPEFKGSCFKIRNPDAWNFASP